MQYRDFQNSFFVLKKQVATINLALPKLYSELRNNSEQLDLRVKGLEEKFKVFSRNCQQDRNLFQETATQFSQLHSENLILQNKIKELRKDVNSMEPRLILSLSKLKPNYLFVWHIGIVVIEIIVFCIILIAAK